MFYFVVQPKGFINLFFNGKLKVSFITVMRRVWNKTMTVLTSFSNHYPSVHIYMYFMKLGERVGSFHLRVFLKILESFRPSLKNYKIQCRVLCTMLPEHTFYLNLPGNWF